VTIGGEGELGGEGMVDREGKAGKSISQGGQGTRIPLAMENTYRNGS